MDKIKKLRDALEEINIIEHPDGLISDDAYYMKDIATEALKETP